MIDIRLDIDTIIIWILVGLLAGALASRVAMGRDHLLEIAFADGFGALFQLTQSPREVSRDAVGHRDRDQRGCAENQDRKQICDPRHTIESSAGGGDMLLLVALEAWQKSAQNLLADRIGVDGELGHSHRLPGSEVRIAGAPGGP